MKMKRCYSPITRLALIWIFLIFVIGCSADKDVSLLDEALIENPYDGMWQDIAEPPFQFVLEQTFGVEEEPAEEILASLGQLTSDREGNIYMLEGRANQLVSFDSAGKFRWRVGREGEGPGEFMNAWGVVWNGEDQLFISNQRGARLEVFDTLGRFIRSHSISELGYRNARFVGVLDPGRLVMTVANQDMAVFGISVIVITVGDEILLEFQIDIDQAEGVEFPEGSSSNSHVSVLNGEIVVAHPSKYQFDFYGAAGDSIRTVTRAMEDLVRPGIMDMNGMRGVRFFSNLYAPVRVGKEYYLVYASWPTNIDDPDDFTNKIISREAPDIETARTYDLYDQNWRLLYSWPDDGDVRKGPRGILHSDGSGFLYSSTRAGFPQLGRYRVEVNPPR